MDSIEPEPARNSSADDGFLKTRTCCVKDYGQPLACGINAM
jgi:hypothetical protein